MPTEPLHAPVDYRLRPLQVLIRKTGGDGNDIEMKCHDDGTVSITVERKGKRHERAKAPTVEEAVAQLRDEVLADHRSEVAQQLRERAEQRRPDRP